MAKKQPNQGGTEKGIQASVLVAREFYFIKADLLRRRWIQEMKRKLSFDMFLLSVSIAYTKYYGRKLPVSAVLQIPAQQPLRLLIMALLTQGQWILLPLKYVNQAYYKTP